jgi:hypothetical protein
LCLGRSKRASDKSFWKLLLDSVRRSHRPNWRRNWKIWRKNRKVDHRRIFGNRSRNFDAKTFAGWTTVECQNRKSSSHVNLKNEFKSFAFIQVWLKIIIFSVKEINLFYYVPFHKEDIKPLNLLNYVFLRLLFIDAHWRKVMGVKWTIGNTNAKIIQKGSLTPY